MVALSCSNIGTNQYEWVETNDTVIMAGTFISYKYPDNLLKTVKQNDKSTFWISFGFPVNPTEENHQSKDDGRLYLIVYVDSIENIDTLIKERGTEAFAFTSTIEKIEILVDQKKALRVTFRNSETSEIVREMIFLNYKNNLYEIEANEFSAVDLDTFIKHFKVVNAP